MSLRQPPFFRLAPIKITTCRTEEDRAWCDARGAYDDDVRAIPMRQQEIDQIPHGRPQYENDPRMNPIKYKCRRDRFLCIFATGVVGDIVSTAAPAQQPLLATLFGAVNRTGRGREPERLLRSLSPARSSYPRQHRSDASRFRLSDVPVSQSSHNFEDCRGKTANNCSCRTSPQSNRVACRSASRKTVVHQIRPARAPLILKPDQAGVVQVGAAEIHQRN